MASLKRFVERSGLSGLIHLIVLAVFLVALFVTRDGSGMIVYYNFGVLFCCLIIFSQWQTLRNMPSKWGFVSRSIVYAMWSFVGIPVMVKLAIFDSSIYLKKTISSLWVVLGISILYLPVLLDRKEKRKKQR